MSERACSQIESVTMLVCPPDELEVRRSRFAMTDEDEARVVGLAVLRRKKAEEKLEMLKAEAKRVAGFINKLGTLLISSPEDIWFEGIAQTSLEQWEAKRAGKFKLSDAGAVDRNWVCLAKVCCPKAQIEPCNRGLYGNSDYQPSVVGIVIRPLPFG